MDSKVENKYISILQIFLAVCPFALGLFFEWTAAFAGIFISMIFILYLVQKKKFIINNSLNFILFVLIAVFSIISFFTSKDKGYSFFGLLRIFILILFALFMMQFENEDKKNILNFLPEASIAMLALSVILIQIPALKNIFIVKNRYIGFPSYANATAFFLVLSFIIFSTREDAKSQKVKNNKVYLLAQVIFPIIITAGIVWTGSRTNLVLMILLIISFTIVRKNLRKPYLMTLLLIMAALIFIILFSGKAESIRSLSFLDQDGSIGIRLLFYRDALKAIAKNPMGIGYQGFYEFQGLYQHGDYFVRFIHNGYLEMMLSFGWVVGGLFIVLVLSAIFHAKGVNKLILILMALRCLFDFDLQFMFIDFYFIALMNFDGKEHEVKKFQPIILLPVILTIFLLPIGFSNGFYYFEKPEIAAKIYPYDFEYYEKIIRTSEDNSIKKTESEKALTLNPYSFQANYFLMNDAIENNKMEEALSYCKNAIIAEPYKEDLYQEYAILYKSAYDLDSEKYKKNHTWLTRKIIKVQTDTDQYSVKQGRVLDLNVNDF